MVSHSASDSKDNQNKENEQRQKSTSSRLLELAIDEFTRKCGFDDLPTKGKPIKIEDGNALTGIMKNANYQPAWVELRKITADIKQQLKIMNYIRIVSNPLLQKGLRNQSARSL